MDLRWNKNINMMIKEMNECYQDVDKGRERGLQ